VAVDAGRTRGPAD
jgi:hypothetical protein